MSVRNNLQCVERDVKPYPAQPVVGTLAGSWVIDI